MLLIMEQMNKKNNTKKIKINDFFEQIIEKNITEIKALKSSNYYQNIKQKSIGINYAIDGIINFSKENDIYNVEYIKMIQKILKKRYKSKWNDKFDEDYFKTWIKFFNFLQNKVIMDKQ